MGLRKYMEFSFVCGFKHEEKENRNNAYSMLERWFMVVDTLREES